MKINEIIRLSNAFAAEVNVLRDYSYRNPDGNESKIKGYLPNKSSREIIRSILLSCPENTDKKLHLITASYGTGKSYLLLMLANLLANNNKEAINSFIEKIHDKEEFYKDKLSTTLDNHVENSDPFLIVIPEYGDNDFSHALLEGLKYALQKNDIDYLPKTNYEEAVKIIKHWETRSPNNYKSLKDLIKNTTIEKFIEQLISYNPGTYSDFKNLFKEIIGAPFSETHTSAFPVYSDTAKAIRKKGYRGIAIIYDEFGEMLGKLINSSSSSTGIAVQHFLEEVKAKTDNSNIVFISVSHQDPQTLRASKERELNKIIGRFERHQLMVSEAEGEEIMGTIFIKTDQNEFKKIYKHQIFSENLDTIQEFDLYPDKDIKWMETKLLKNLYPLHPLTSYILPRLSAEFAQNTRSMFNFLSPTETKDGAFRYYLESNDVIFDGKINLFTPDLLLDFFLKNIREDKEGRIQMLYDVYRMAIGRAASGVHQCVMKNLFMLYVVNNSAIKPTKRILFWAMNWEESRRKEFNDLLDDLVEVHEYLEFNPTDKTYQFPDFGAAPLSKIIEEEAKKLDDLGISNCLRIWEEIIPLEIFLLRDHNNRYGCNRSLKTEAVEDVGAIMNSIKNLNDYYQKSNQYFANGYLFYLIASSEDEIEDMKTAINSSKNMLPYIVYGIPINLLHFDGLVKETVQFKAIQNTAKRSDIIQNPARIKNIQDQLEIVTGRLEEKIKTIYEPNNWKWNYLTENDIEITSKPKFSNWVGQKFELLFSETPTIKDEALWYTPGSKGSKDRKMALDLLLNAEKDRLILKDDDKNSAHKRIIRNFFTNIELTTDKKREKNIQYGEIKAPDTDSKVYNAWKHIDNKLKSSSYVAFTEIFNPLLQAPYGLSDNIIEFLVTVYIRYDIERIVIMQDTKWKSVQSVSLDVIEDMINKPSNYLIRKLEISGPELRYLKQLKTLFDKQDVNSWMDVTQKFIGIVQYLTPLHRSIIQESGEKDLQNFYASLETLKNDFQENNTDKEKLSQEYFQEYLPSLIFNEGKILLENNTKVAELINKLDAFKKYPTVKETERKLDVIQALAEDVFGTKIVTKVEITKVVLTWFKGLPTSNQNGKFSNDGIKKWINDIKMQLNNDPFDLYLDKLNQKPFKEWVNFSYEKFMFISKFKEYKTEVEQYTKSPLEVLQRIARVVFDKSDVDCDSEEKFDGLFKNWWNKLSNHQKTEQYSSETNLLISQILLPSSIKARYLETIPQTWKANNNLPEYLPKEWESWDIDNIMIVANKYLECIQEVNNWKPPVEEIQVYVSIGHLFNIPNADSLSILFSSIAKWQEELPERTKSAKWELLNEHVSKFLASINDIVSFEKFIIVELPFIWKFPPFKQWNTTILESYCSKFELLIKRITEFRRPLFEIVEKLEDKTAKKSSNTEEFCFRLCSAIKDSDAYKNKISTDLLNNQVSTILFELAKKSSSDFSLLNILPAISTKLNISTEWHLWNDKDEKNFVTNFNNGIGNLIKWKFPEAEKLKKAKDKVKLHIAELQKELALDDLQMRKVLNDILEGR